MNKRTKFLHIALILMLFVLTGCCYDIVKHKQKVNMYPFMELEIPSDVNVLSDILDFEDTFDDYELSDTYAQANWHGEQGKNPGYGGMDVYFSLLPNIEQSKDYFQQMCESGWVSASVFERNDSYQYCISYVQEEKLPIDSFCSATGHYKSSIVFQKDRLVITIREDSLDKNSTRKDDAIRLLVEKMSQSH